ncbi:hypothetical protein [Okeania sp. KiyG1]|uniref:hypothetical protein n=1 Tax=Okeania sp. KiyG1 TaxID=2720165 RepID=UPI001923811A|nr:hypothetical protein [Okeania sp. KiyG1]
MKLSKPTPEITEKFRYKASPFMEKKAVERWMGFLTISNRPREEKHSFNQSS